MTNQERIKEYLVGENGYLKSDISNGKVIMLSGVWGSGKTHFWQHKIIPSLNDEKNKIPNHYISLYGKTSIEEIKNEIFLKVFESVDSSETGKKALNLAKNTANLVSSLSNTISVFGMSLDLSKVTDKTFNGLEKLLDDEKLKKTEAYLNSGAIICFDDFERKSKDIDLNDLFGFISQLTLNFDCKVVIILNEDIFEGKEKDIFSNVKEKTVSKFLNYNPTIKELFNSIYDEHNIKSDFPNMEEYIQKYFEEVNLLNARIYEQVLDNLLEWYKYKKDLKESISNNERRCLVLVNINFILHHSIAKRGNGCYLLKDFYNQGFTYDENRRETVMNSYKTFNSFDKYFNYTIANLVNRKDSQPEFRKKYQEFLEENIEKFKSEFFINRFDIARDVDNIIFEKINNFIETGILIKDKED